MSLDGRSDGSEDHHRGPQQFAALGPRRVSLPSSAAAGGVPFPAVGAPALRRPGSVAGVHSDTPEVSAPAQRETARHDRSVHAAPGCCPAVALPPVLGAPGRQVGGGAVHRSGASPGRATRAAWTVSMDAGDLVPGHGSQRAPRMPRTLRASLRRHNGFLFSSLRRCCAFRPVRAPSLPESTSANTRTAPSLRRSATTPVVTGRRRVYPAMAISGVRSAALVFVDISTVRIGLAQTDRSALARVPLVAPHIQYLLRRTFSNGQPVRRALRLKPAPRHTLQRPSSRDSRFTAPRPKSYLVPPQFNRSIDVGHENRTTVFV